MQEGHGYLNAPATLTDNLTIRGKCGSTVLWSAVVTGTLLNTFANQPFSVRVATTAIGTGAGGTFVTNDFALVTSSTLTAAIVAKIVTTSPVAYDFTTTCGYDMTAQWGGAQVGESVTGTNVFAYSPGAPVTGVNGATGAVQITPTASKGIAVSSPTGLAPAFTMSRTVRTVTGTDSASASDCGNVINFTSASSFTETLPQATGTMGSGCTIKVSNGAAISTGAIITFATSTSVFQGSGAGSANFFLGSGSSLDLTSNGTDWIVAASFPMTLYSAVGTACLSADSASYTLGSSGSTACTQATSDQAWSVANFTFPANFIGANTQIQECLEFALTSSGSPPNQTIKIKMGATTLFTSSGTGASATLTNRSGAVCFLVHGTTAVSASSAVEVSGNGGGNNLPPGFSGGTNSGEFANLATNGALAETITDIFAAGTAGNATGLRKVTYTWLSF